MHTFIAFAHTRTSEAVHLITEEPGPSCLTGMNQGLPVLMLQHCPRRVMGEVDNHQLDTWLDHGLTKSTNTTSAPVAQAERQHKSMGGVRQSPQPAKPPKTPVFNLQTRKVHLIRGTFCGPLPSHLVHVISVATVATHK